MHLLITGGAGFIGSNFTKYILNKYKNYKVTVLDKLTYAGNLENLEKIKNNSNFKFIKQDICEKKIVKKIIQQEKIDVIINFAAETHVDRALYKPSSFLKTDIFGTFTLLEIAKESKISLFIQISTDEVYGSILKGSFREKDALFPSSIYSASKAGADLLVYAYSVTFKLPVIITRSSNNFGAYQHIEKFIPLFITNALEDKKLPLYGKGENIRDWLYVIDNCRAIDIVLHYGKIGEIYNIATHEEKTNLEIANMILERLNKPKELIVFVNDRPGHDKRYSLDTNKIKKLGWQPQYNFKEALKQTIKWYKENKYWWQKIKSKEFNKYYKKMYQERLKKYR